jgi:hypothetical protein
MAILFFLLRRNDAAAQAAAIRARCRNALIRM